MAENTVLLISPSLKSMMVKGRPHLGLGLLARKLNDAGYEVHILDYIVDRGLPPLRDVVDSLRPSVAGITVNTAFWDVADSMLDVLAGYPHIKKLVGGPHATLYHQDLCGDGRIDYIFRGESEENIVEVCRAEKHSAAPQVVGPAPPDMAHMPHPAFEFCLSSECIVEYPLQTSRGCPYGCIFCEVSAISSKKWRPRPVNDILEELESVKSKFKNVKVIEIQDDNAAHDMERFKEFVRGYIGMRGEWELRVDNIRADNVDEEITGLLKEAGCVSISLGVEHADPDIFKSINKGETLAQIGNAAALIRKSGMKLGMCFVIGLPGDSFEKTKQSVMFAKENKADYAFWNILVPHRGTRVREWFEKHGRLHDERNFTSLVDDQIMNCSPVCETASFNAKEIARAHFWAVLATNTYRLTKRNLLFVILTALRYGFVKDLVGSLSAQMKMRSSAGKQNVSTAGGKSV